VRWLLIDEFRVAVAVPAGDRRAADGVRRALAGGRFLARLRAAARAVCDRPPALRRARVTVSR